MLWLFHRLRQIRKENQTDRIIRKKKRIYYLWTTAGQTVLCCLCRIQFNSVADRVGIVMKPVFNMGGIPRRILPSCRRSIRHTVADTRVPFTQHPPITSSWLQNSYTVSEPNAAAAVAAAAQVGGSRQTLEKSAIYDSLNTGDPIPGQVCDFHAR